MFQIFSLLANLFESPPCRPTIMCAVPLILDRIYKNIQDNVDKRGSVFRRVFDFCLNYKV